MKYYLDSDMANFPWWSGARDNFQDLKRMAYTGARAA